MAACRVLVVDDDAVIRDLVAEALTEMGYAVDTAAGGAEALDRLTHTEPAVLLQVSARCARGYRTARNGPPHSGHTRRGIRPRLSLAEAAKPSITTSGTVSSCRQSEQR